MTDFAAAVVRWQVLHGRSGLPWQGTRDPYRVWLSEIMLQQTQVSAVTAYFGRFLDRFPTVQALAGAELDDVMGLWSGLGYYSRARNLHRCAQEVVQRFDGRFPETAELLMTLPGIGRSTASAIAAFCFGQRVSILDGNVKRVLTRYLGYDQDLSRSAHERVLWNLATELLPHDPDAMPAYTQGLMDLGATVCTPQQPGCGQCPVQAACEARRSGDMERFPVKTRKVQRKSEAFWLLWASCAPERTWLCRRPDHGIWASLFSLPAYGSLEDLVAVVPLPLRGLAAPAAPIFHVLTHRDLYLHPVKVNWTVAASPPGQGGWYGPSDWTPLGLPAPIRQLLTDRPGNPAHG